MHTIPLNVLPKEIFWRNLVALAILATILLSAALDRRNLVYGRDTADFTAGGHQVTTPSLEELVREMMTHDRDAPSS